MAAPVLQLFASLHHLGTDEFGALLICASGNREFPVIECVIRTFIRQNGHWAISAEKQPVIVCTHETGLPLHVEAFLLGQLIVTVDIMDEHRCLVNATVGACPGVRAKILIIVTLFERSIGIDRAPLVIVGDIAVAEIHVIGETVQTYAALLFSYDIGKVGLQI